MAVPTPTDSHALALVALATAIADERRARRFLDLTGIETDELRARAADPVLLAALIRFLEAHEPDLVAVAEAMSASPQMLVAARRELEEGQ
ncbi:MAG: DUF3572 family protein [Sphingomicrobium sp.]